MINDLMIYNYNNTQNPVKNKKRIQINYNNTLVLPSTITENIHFNTNSVLRSPHYNDH